MDINWEIVAIFAKELKNPFTAIGLVVIVYGIWLAVKWTSMALFWTSIGLVDWIGVRIRRIRQN